MCDLRRFYKDKYCFKKYSVVNLDILSYYRMSKIDERKVSVAFYLKLFLIGHDDNDILKIGALIINYLYAIVSLV